MATDGAAEGEATVQAEGYTPIADIKLDATVNVLGVCTCDAWPIGNSLWKFMVADSTGRTVITMKRPGFKIKSKDVVAARSLLVKAYKGRIQLVAVKGSIIDVNPDTNEEIEKLREWHQERMSQMVDQRANEGFTPIGSLTAKTLVHVLAVCSRQPWRVGRLMWKVLLKDESGQVVGLRRKTEFGFKMNDVVAGYSLWVGEYKGTVELEVRHTSEVVVNPDTAAASQLREWYQNQASQVENLPITPIADLKSYTNASVLAVCTSDPMERPRYGSKRRGWQVTLRDSSGFMNAVKEGENFNFGLNDVVEAHGVFIRGFTFGGEIVVEGNTVITVNPETEEAAKLKEWYQNEGIQETLKVTDSTEVDLKLAQVAKNLLRSTNQLHCDLCDVWCSEKTYNNHVSGRAHQNALLKRSNGGAADVPAPPKKSKMSTKSGDEPNEFRCDVCDTSMVGKVTYDTHMQGARHLKQVQETEAASFVASQPHIEQLPDKKGYRCTICQVPMTSRVVALNHVTGAKHRRTAARYLPVKTPGGNRKLPAEVGQVPNVVSAEADVQNLDADQSMVTAEEPEIEKAEADVQNLDADQSMVTAEESEIEKAEADVQNLDATQSTVTAEVSGIEKAVALGDEE